MKKFTILACLALSLAALPSFAAETSSPLAGTYQNNNYSTIVISSSGNARWDLITGNGPCTINNLVVQQTEIRGPITFKDVKGVTATATIESRATTTAFTFSTVPGLMSGTNPNKTCDKIGGGNAGLYTKIPS